MIEIHTAPITNNVRNKIKNLQKADYKNYFNWRPAGSGNFEKTKTDGRYRENCNTYRDTITGETTIGKRVLIRSS